MTTLIDDVAGQPGSITGSQVKKERGTHAAYLCAWAVLMSACAGAYGHVAHWFFTGVSPVDFSCLPLHDGMFKTCFENFDLWVWIKHPLFQEQALIPVVRKFQKSNTHKFTWFGNLPTPRNYWFVLIKLRNNTINKIRRRRKFFST